MNSMSLRSVFLLLLSLIAIYALWTRSTSIPAFKPRQTVQVDPNHFEKRIVAVGDIHGDMPHLRTVLGFSGLIDSHGRWTGGSDILVQTGDLVDRGTDTIALYRYFDVLRDQSRDAGGDVRNLLGNHELMNAMNDWRYVTKEDIATFGSADDRRKAMSASGWIGQTWRANYSIVQRVPFFTQSSIKVSNPIDPFVNSGVAFVHGGIIPAYLEGLSTEDPVKEINTIGASFLSVLTPFDSSRSKWTPRDFKFFSEIGPMWSRDYALKEEAEACEMAQDASRTLQVQYLVMGHTPHFDAMKSRCKDGRIVLIDTGISRAYGGRLSALEIKFTLDRREGKSWNERVVVSALYEESTEALSQSHRVIDL